MTGGIGPARKSCPAALFCVWQFPTYCNGRTGSRLAASLSGLWFSGRQCCFCGSARGKPPRVDNLGIAQPLPHRHLRALIADVRADKLARSAAIADVPADRSDRRYVAPQVVPVSQPINATSSPAVPPSTKSPGNTQLKTGFPSVLCQNAPSRSLQRGWTR